MFTCTMCKEEISGEPVLVNAAGSFCADCNREVNDRKTAGIRRHYGRTNNNPDMELDMRMGDTCAWCLKEINKANPPSLRTTALIHRGCDSHRNWLLECIRVSDRPYEYVARVEEREKPKRVQREVEKRLAEAEQEKTVSVEVSAQEDNRNENPRMDRLEKMMEILIREFGIKMEETL